MRNFLPKDKRLSIIHEDGRVYLKNNQKKYNAIFIDALFSLTPPFQLTTSEAVSQMKNALEKDGVVMVNIISSLKGENSKILEAQYVTYLLHFKHVYLFATNKKSPYEIQNIVLIAHNSDKLMTLQNKNEELNVLLQNNWKFENQFSLPPLTDDLAPIDQYASILLNR